MKRRQNDRGFFRSGKAERREAARRGENLREARPGRKFSFVTDTLYQMVWPQEFENDGDLVVSVAYTMTLPAEDEGEDPISSTFTKDVKIPAAEWEAGNRYVYTLLITPSDIQLIFKFFNHQT